MQPRDPGFSPADVGRALARHWGKMAFFSLAVLALAAAGVASTPRSYRAQAKLIVRLGRENATLDSTATLGQSPVVVAPATREAEINSLLEVLHSRALLQKVVDSVGPEVVLGTAPPGDPEPPRSLPDPTEPSDLRYQALRKLTRGLRAEAIRKSNVVAVSYDGPSPDTARAVVARLVELYLDQHMALSRSPGTYKFLAGQSDRLAAQVRATEAELAALKNKTGLVSPDGQRQVLVARVGRLEDELLQAAAAAAAAAAEERALARELGSLPRTHVTAVTKGVPNHAADLMRGQLYALQLKELDLLSRHPANHPEVKLIRKQVAEARKLLGREDPAREQVTTGPSKVAEEAQVALARQRALLASLEARAEALRRQLARERDALKAFTADELRLARLQRRLDLEVAHHRKYAENLEQGQIDRALQAERISNISVAQPAACDLHPVHPRWKLNMAMALLLAASGSVGLALLAEWRRTAADRTPAEPQDAPGAAVPRPAPPTSLPESSLVA